MHDIEFDPKGAATTRSQTFMPKRPSPLPPEEPAEPQPGPDLPPVQEPPPEEPDVEPVRPVQDPLRDPVQPPPKMITSANVSVEKPAARPRQVDGMDENGSDNFLYPPND